MATAIFYPSRKSEDHAARQALGDKDAPASKKARVLLVEDEYLTAMYAEEALLDAGFEVIGLAASADEAINLACTVKPDLIVMDIRLSGERDGVEAAKEIFRKTGIRCVFASAYSTPEIRERARAVSPLGWVPKPYTPQALVLAVGEALRELARQ